MPNDLASSDNVYLGTEATFSAAVSIGDGVGVAASVGVKLVVGWTCLVAVRLGVGLVAIVGVTVRVRVGTSEGTTVEIGKVPVTVAVAESCRRLPLVAVIVDEAWRVAVGVLVGADVASASEDGVVVSGATATSKATLRATKDGFFTL
jgi:hypothetical protein